MPQMKPMNWLMLLYLFTMMFILFFIMTHIFTNTNKDNILTNNNLNKNKMMLTW